MKVVLKVTSGEEDLEFDFDEKFLGIDTQKFYELFLRLKLNLRSREGLQCSSPTTSLILTANCRLTICIC